MPNVTPTYRMATIASKLADFLQIAEDSESVPCAFPTRVAASNDAPDDVAKHIFFEEIRPELLNVPYAKNGLPRPLAVIITRGARMVPYAGGSADFLIHEGDRIDLYVEIADKYPTPQPGDLKNSFFDAANFFGHLERNLRELSGADTNLSLETVNRPEGPQRPHARYQQSGIPPYWFVNYELMAKRG